MPAGVPPTVEESFAALIPAAMVMIVFFTINLLFGFLGTNVFQIIFEFLQTPLLNLGDTLGAMVVAYIFLHLFWFFGVMVVRLLVPYSIQFYKHYQQEILLVNIILFANNSKIYLLLLVEQDLLYH